MKGTRRRSSHEILREAERVAAWAASRRARKEALAESSPLPPRRPRRPSHRSALGAAEVAACDAQVAQLLAGELEPAELPFEVLASSSYVLSGQSCELGSAVLAGAAAPAELVRRAGQVLSAPVYKGRELLLFERVPAEGLGVVQAIKKLFSSRLEAVEWVSPNA